MRADPIEARRRWVGRNRRAKRVLDALAVHANAGSSGMPGIGKGVALAQCYDSIIGLVTEVEATGGGQWRVKRIQAIVDCGWTLNTASVEAQIFGGIVFGLTAALHGRVALAEGELRVRNFDDYPLLRGFEVPPIAVEILPALDDLPGGVGELGVPPVAPSLVNAIAAAGLGKAQAAAFARLDSSPTAADVNQRGAMFSTTD